MGVARHLLTTFGGVLITKGLIDESMLPELIGSLTTLTGIIWSVIEKKKKQ